MRAVIRIRHPAAVVHVPPKARIARTSVVECVTPMRLAEADRDEFRPIGSLRRWENRAAAARGGPGNPDYPDEIHEGVLSQRLFTRDGGIWTVLRTEPLGPSGSWRPVSAQELTAFLTGNPVDPATDLGIRRALARSPLVVRGLDRDRVAAGSAGFRQGAVAFDGRQDAEAVVAAWVGRHIAVVGTDVRVRSTGPLVVHAGARSGRYVLETMAHGCDVPTAMAYRPGDVGTGTFHESQLMGDATMGRLRQYVGRDDVLAHVANAMPDEMLRIAAIASRPSVAGMQWAEGIDAIVPAMRDLAARAMTGALGAGHAEPVARLVATLATELSPSHRREGAFELSRTARFARDYVPELAAAIPEADAEDLGGLAP